MNAKLFISLACVSLGLTACSDDYFDKDAYNNQLKQAFPVDNVDPNHTWATTGTLSASVTVNGDYGENYRVAVYLENPLYNKTVTLLTSKTIASGEVTDMKFSYPLGKSILYFTCFDKTNHYIVKTIDVSEQQHTYSVNFFGEMGSGARQKRSAEYDSSNHGTRASVSNSSYTAFVKDRESKLSVSDWVNASWISNKVTVDVSTMGSSDDFATIDQAALSNESVQNDNRSNHWWRIESGTTLDGINQKICDDQNTLNKGVVYIEGQLTMSTNDAGQQVTWIVGNGGKLIIPQSVSLGQCARIVVMEGGEVEISNGVNVTFSGKSQSAGFYNAGDVTFPATVYFNGIGAEWGATLYNVGTMRINNVEALRRLYNFGTLYIDNSFSIGQNDGHSALNYYFYNQGYMEVADGKTLTLAGAVNYGELNGTTLDISDNYYFNGGTSAFKTINVKQLTNFGKLTIEENLDDKGERWTVNGCYLHITKDQTSATGFRKLIMLENSLLELDGDMFFQENNGSYMEDKSLIKVGGDFNIPKDGAVWDGPSGSGQYAIVKIAGDINMDKWCSLTRATSGAVYLDWANIADGVNHSSIGNKEGKSDAEAVESMLAKMASDLISETTVSPTITIDGGDCTGGGYKGTTASVTPPVEVVQGYRFCFEDNFPAPGDYDFNDCVITVYPEVNDRVVTLKVSLDGVGSTKQVAAAMRIVDISADDIVASGTSCNTNLDGSSYIYPLIANETSKWSNIYYIAPNNLGTTASGRQINDLVVRLFNDAHYAISGSFDRKFYNTVSPLDPLAGEANVDNSGKTAELTFTFTLMSAALAQQFADQANYDVFIVEMHNARIFEVHTCPFKFDQVLKAYRSDMLSVFQDASTGNYPWAVSVPHSENEPFYYPREWWTISGTKMQEGQAQVTPAVYPRFKNWATNQSSDPDWYKYPENERVFKFTY